jgi:Sulfatase
LADVRARPAERAARLREPAVRLAQLLVASAFALAQPLFDILGKNAEFFAVRGSTPGDIVLFASVVTFGPALVLVAIELAVGAFAPRAGLALHLVLLAALAVVCAIQALERLGLDGTVPLVAASLAAGAATAVAAWRTAIVRTFLTVLTPAPFLFLGLFLLNTPVQKLVFPADAEVELAAVRGSTPVVMVVFDELPVISLLDANGEIDTGRYPNFARLARDSVWFRNATTLSAQTTLAVPSLLSGIAPERGKLPVYARHPDNLFTFLGGHYALDVTESQTRLCPAELCGGDREDAETRLSSLWSDARVVYLHLVAPPALEDRLPAIDEAWGDFGHDGGPLYEGREGDFRRFVASFVPERGGAPTLSFLHVLLPHGPWIHFPDGRVSAVENPRAPGRTDELWWDEGLAVQAWQRHLLQLGYTDGLLGRLLDRLERTGAYDRALVVVTADHGISFRGGDRRRTPTDRNLAELAFTPLFVNLPGPEPGRVVDRHVGVVDVLPTIADALDADIPWRTDGTSALVDGPGPDTVRVGRLAVPYADAVAQRGRSLARQTRLFGQGAWDVDFYALGPYAGLVGRPVADLSVAPGEGVVTFDAAGSGRVRSLDADSPLVPSPLTGALSGVGEGTALALALNGRVAAVATAYAAPEGGPAKVTALVPPSFFRPGENEVRVFVLEGSPAEPALLELRTELSD